MFEIRLPDPTARRANSLIYKYTGMLCANKPAGEHITNPSSDVAAKADKLVGHFTGIKVEDHRITTVAAIALIDFSVAAQQLRTITPEDFSAEA